jgi:hypothetical protein
MLFNKNNRKEESLQQPENVEEMNYGTLLDKLAKSSTPIFSDDNEQTNA